MSLVHPRHRRARIAAWDVPGAVSFVAIGHAAVQLTDSRVHRRDRTRPRMRAKDGFSCPSRCSPPCLPQVSNRKWHPVPNHMYAALVRRSEVEDEHAVLLALTAARWRWPAGRMQRAPFVVRPADHVEADLALEAPARQQLDAPLEEIGV